MATIYDVAREANCSSATVSRALANDPRISERTRIRVHESARRLGYRLNPVARALSRGRSYSIGLVIPKLDAQIFSAGTTLLQDLLSQAGYRIILACHGDNPDRESEALHSLVQYNVDGIIHVPCTSEGSQRVNAREHNIPVIELIRRSEMPDVDAVVADREQGSFELTRHLLGLGHRRITLLIRDDRYGGAELMESGFNSALRQAELDANQCLVKRLGPDETPSAIVQELLRKGTQHTAIIAGSTELSYELLHAVQGRKVQIPNELSIAGYLKADWSAISNPSLTAYETPLHEIGLLAAQMLLNRLEPRVERDLSYSVVRCSGRLVVRSSTGSARRRLAL